MALFVEMPIVMMLLLAIATRRNHRLSATTENSLTKIIGIIGFVSKHKIALVAKNQSFCLSDIMSLPTSECETQRIAQSIDVYMNLGTEAATAAT